MNWLIFLACLLGPGALTCLAVLMDKSSDGPAPLVIMIGGALGGIGCGVILGRRLGRNLGLKVVIGLIFGVVCSVASITIAFAGCAAFVKEQVVR